MVLLLSLSGCYKIRLPSLRLTYYFHINTCGIKWRFYVCNLDIAFSLYPELVFGLEKKEIFMFGVAERTTT